MNDMNELQPFDIEHFSPDENQYIEASAGKILAYRYQYDYYVDFPMEITFNTATAQKKLEIGIDFANAGGANLAKIRKTGISGTIALKDKNGKVCSENSFKR